MVCYYRKLLLEMIVIIIVRNFPAVYEGNGWNVYECVCVLGYVWVKVCVGACHPGVLESHGANCWTTINTAPGPTALQQYKEAQPSTVFIGHSVLLNNGYRLLNS